jgi:hypothetical protein
MGIAYRSFSSDVTAAILVYQNKEMAAILVSVNSMSFIWNDNMREKREANANAT